MCGGSGARMTSVTEKPLVKVGGIPMVLRVANAIHDSNKFDRVLAAVSPNAPATKSLLQEKGMETIETSGDGYSQDLSLLLDKLKPARVFVTSADLPLISAQIVNEIASMRQNMPLLSVIVTKQFVENIGIIPSVKLIHSGVEYCQSGISVFDTSRQSSGEFAEEYLVMDRIELAANVNTEKDLGLAEELLIQRA